MLDYATVLSFDGQQTVNAVPIQVLDPDSMESGDIVLSSGQIIPTVTNIVLLEPSSSVTGIILQAGTNKGQDVWLINEAVSANSITFAADATSNVSNGLSITVNGAMAAHFVWNDKKNLWYKSS